MGSQVIIQGTYALGLANLYLKQHTLVSLYPHSLILHTLFYGPEIHFIITKSTSQIVCMYNLVK